MTDDAAKVFTPERWRQFWNAWKDEPQQQAGAEELRQRIVGLAPELLTEEASWVCNFHKACPEACLAPVAPKQQQAIPVPYFCQLNMQDGQGARDCFSTVAAMIAAWKGKVAPTVAGENTYNVCRQKHGDSTVAGAQLATLTDFGVKATYATNGTKAKLIELLDRGIPVGLGILHHGSVGHPSGGGHWILAVGRDGDSSVIVNDPYGNLGLVTGQWEQVGSGGDHVHYSFKNLIPRWEVAGGDGYMLWVE